MAINPYGVKDLEAWDTWYKTSSRGTSNGDKSKLAKLLKQLKPIYMKEVRKYMSSLPLHVVEGKARLLTIEAVKTYKPGTGVALSTWVATRLQKLNRYTSDIRFNIRVPEHKHQLIRSFEVAKAGFIEDKGREPTKEELTNSLQWDKKTYNTIEKDIRKFSAVPEDANIVDVPGSINETTIRFILNDLSPEEKSLFIMLSGYGIPKIATTNEILRKKGWTQGQLSYKKTGLIKKVKKLAEAWG